ncbi:hypothetical protein PTTG_25151 [Puccinia triticina 1-1 BBBD Race 1]|uniref:Uncharacterized protein n=1 Tax=Puccinia triticina (isolate 1-1 / race 1 (BBBD)) TaxID=630390 RepID=A0A180H511_PUCT1|nr:hypothetical protein PTTG_25151 [Puccinia triticina 1-1 BBBD Race 1]
MSLATPAPRHPQPSAPPSPPPPVFALTSAFFESPFSPQPPAPAGRSSLRADQLDTLLGDAPRWPASTPSTPAAQQAQWTPLSTRAAPVGRHPPHQEDRLDRLLAAMEAHAAARPADSPPPCPASPPPAECWELLSLETRFQPRHACPLRPCLKIHTRSLPLAVQPEEEEEHPRTTASLPAQPSALLDLARRPQDDRPSSARVRFDDATVEQLLTWSRESYDRKGPLPITKLNLRELIELKLIKEELGISPVPVSVPIEPSPDPSSASDSDSSSSSSSSDASSSASSDASSSSSPSSDSHSPGAHPDSHKLPPPPL